MKSVKLLREPVRDGSVVSVVRIEGDAPVAYHEVGRVRLNDKVDILDRRYDLDDRAACELGLAFAAQLAEGIEPLPLR